MSLSHPHIYDVVIIGSGAGSLLCAALLAKEGMNVCVLERDKQAGGCLQTFALHKKVFDSCVHYIGGLGEGHTLWQIFKYVGIMDQLRLQSLDTNGFDRIAFANEPELYPQAISSNNFIEQLLPYFPNAKSALQQYLNTIQSVTSHFPLYQLRNGDAGEKVVVSHLSLTDVLAGITPDRRLQNVLAGNNLLYAGVAGQTPFYIHALVLESYIHSAHKVIPGSSQITKLLHQQIHQHGGTLLRNTPVVKLAEENGRIAYAESVDGQRFYGRNFIAGIHPAEVLKLIDSPLVRPAYRKRITALEQTTAAFMLNLVVRPGTVPVRHYNIYWHATDSVWEAEYSPATWPANYAAYFMEDPLHLGFAESISILTYMHYSEVAQWADTYNRIGDEHTRGQDYEEFKEKKAASLLEKVCQRIPELNGNIIAQGVATPLTYRDYTGTPQGALYGILKDVNKPSETTIATRTRIPNLLLTGQNVNLHGILGVSITAIATCAELVGLDYLLDKIKNKKGQQQ